MRHALAALIVTGLMVAAASSVLAVNEETTLLIHVDPTIFGGCELAEGDNDPCSLGDAGGANTSLGSPGQIPTVYLVARNYESLRGVQTAFDWTGHSLVGQGWDCRANQLSATMPDPATSGGPTDGTIATAFDVISGGESAVIGRMNVTVGDGDCVAQVESAFDNGTHVLDEFLRVTPIYTEQRGSACVSNSGVDACERGADPVEARSWGAIKAAYRQ